MRRGDLEDIHHTKGIQLGKVTNTDIAKMPEEVKIAQAKLVEDLERLNRLKTDHHKYVHDNIPLQKFPNRKDSDPITRREDPAIFMPLSKQQETAGNTGDGFFNSPPPVMGGTKGPPSRNGDEMFAPSPG